MLLFITYRAASTGNNIPEVGIPLLFQILSAAEVLPWLQPRQLKVLIETIHYFGLTLHQDVNTVSIGSDCLFCLPVVVEFVL